VDTQATPDFAQIDAYVNAQVQDARIPGLALGIIHGDQVAHLHGFGEADSTGRAVTPPTVSHWLIDKIIYRTGDYAIG